MSRLTLFLAFYLALPLGAWSEPLLLCGGDEVFLIETDTAQKGSIEKLWSWRAKDHDELPEAIRGKFRTTDDCKPVDEGHKLLISSSGGGAALVEYPSGRVLWHAQVLNAHSLELLRGDHVIAASPQGSTRGKLLLFSLQHADAPIWETTLPSAHGIIWDAVRQRLWALGFQELRCYTLKDWDTASPSLALEMSYPLPDEGGHDLQAVPGGNDLSVTNHRGVLLFDREKHTFRSHLQLADTAHVKSMTFLPNDGRVAYLQADMTTPSVWWTTTLRFLSPAAEIKLPGEHLYKARWMPQAGVRP